MVPDQEILSIHSLCLLGISDYFTRCRAIKTEQPILIGGLLGRNNSIIYSFEILVNENGIDEQFLELKLQQLKTIYPNNEFVGFYHISENLAVSDLVINLISSLSTYNLNEMLYLIVNPAESQIPLRISSLSNLETFFAYKVDSTPSEQYSLNSLNEAVLKPVLQTPFENFTAKNDSLKRSLVNLDNKITKILAYLRDDGGYEDDELLMEIDKLVFEIEYVRLNEEFKKEADGKRLEALLTATSNLMILMKHD